MQRQFPWPCKPLGEICDPFMGNTPPRANPLYWGDGHPWLSIADMSQGKFITSTKERITTKAVNDRRSRLVQPGTLLMSFKLSIGKLAFAQMPLYTNEAIVALPIRKPDSLLERYLYYALQVVDLNAETDTAAKGKTLNKSKIEQILVPLPSPEEQRRIADILDKADAVRRKRQEAIRLSEEFLRSVFLDMFGDIATNQTSTHRLLDLAEDSRGSFVNGPFGSNLLTTELRRDGVPVIYIRDIRDGEYTRLSPSHVTPQKANELSVCQVAPGDVLVTKVGDPPGTGAVYPKGEPLGIISQDVIRIRIDREKVTAEFLVAFLNSPIGRHAVRSIIVEATRSRFSLRDFKNLSLALPPLPEQQRFSNLARKVCQTKERLVEANIVSDEFFSSLTQRAFAGKL